MGLWWFGDTQSDAEDDMAKKAKAKVEIDQTKVSQITKRLTALGTDRTAFETVVGAIKADSELKSADVIAIAHAYIGGGKKPSSKVSALDAINKRFVEIVRFHKKNDAAAKARPW